MSRLVVLAEGARIFGSAISRKLLGWRRWGGDAESICEQIVEALFDAERGCYRTSLSTYPGFWARDFGRSAPALLAIGREREVGATYRFALGHYERVGRFAVTLTPSGRPFDFPWGCYAPDGFALFVHGLAALGDGELVRRHRGWLEREARRFFESVVDPGSGLVRRGVHFSEARDYARRDSSCYSNVMCHVLSRALARLGLPDPLSRYDYAALIPARFLRGDRFLDDARHPEIASGDANVLPFWSGLLGHGDDARELFVRVLARMDAEGLNTPLPSRYGASAANPGEGAILLDRLNPWQRDAVWPCLGLHLAEALRDYALPRLAAVLAAYRGLVERLRCFPEVIDARSGSLFRSSVYCSEDSMIWAANLLALLRRGG